ncbi:MULTISPECIES: hypothetical protein [unclassified Clostridium]|uniref:hypothetical protein n=1 Tax=unclassified Clostridium TaxID=2614128 RepID=UPI001A22E042|nr:MULTISPECIES: hypothetical protein [unclassified Clostridium]MBX9139075.1 hypothetical protein [Clostridium sp. K12(2020)]MBX9145854.1 hypothetical protein [Clostridium sp. K13]HAT4183832.1 hypothetical protein [Clostridium perfringens]
MKLSEAKLIKKKCSKCKELRLITEFNKDSSKKMELDQVAKYVRERLIKLDMIINVEVISIS